MQSNKDDVKKQLLSFVDIVCDKWQNLRLDGDILYLDEDGVRMAPSREAILSFDLLNA